MKPAAINFGCVWIAVALIALPAASRGATTAPAGPAAPTLRDLLVHGTGEYLWAADVMPSEDPDAPSVRTTVRFRTTGETQWRPAAQFEARAASLGSRGTELLVALENGEWMIVAEDGARAGMTLPGGADVLALAGAGDDLWAVAAAPAGSPSLPPPATHPAVTRATPATRRASSTPPATTPAARALGSHDLGLFRLKRGAWEEIDALPPKIRRDDLVAVVLLPVDRRLMLGVATEDLAVRVYWRALDDAGAAGRWQGDDKPVAVLPADGRLKLMSYHGRALLWLAGPDGLGRIVFASAPEGAEGAGAPPRGDGWDAPIRIEPSPTLPAHFDRRALAMALGQLRLVATDGKGRIAEQVYSTEGKPAGPVTEAVAAPLPGDNRVAPMVEMLVLLVLFLSMIGAMRQRPNLAEAVRNIHRLHLAPLTRRFVGGVIDALPMLICGYIGLAGTDATPPGGAAPAVTWESPEVRWVVGGILLYLLHVTVLEALLARSIGKLITGTRVAALDGAVPRLSAILVRNLLRPLDVLLLVLLYLSPLRQRVGDMAAGTLVVLASPPPREPEEDTESEPATTTSSSDSPPPDANRNVCGHRAI